MCGNFFFMVVMGRLLRYIDGLRRLRLEVYFVFLESYSFWGVFYLGRFVWFRVELIEILRDLGRFRIVWFSTSFCFYCGNKIFYDLEFILWFCYMFV